MPKRPRPTMTPDARAAIEAARKGKCKVAFQHLHDASPHNQTRDTSSAAFEKARKDHITASVIYQQFCARGGKSKYPEFTLQGTRGRRRRRRR